MEEMLVHQSEDFIIFLQEWSADMMVYSRAIIESSAVIAGFVGGCVVGAVFFYFVLK